MVDKTDDRQGAKQGEDPLRKNLVLTFTRVSVPRVASQPTGLTTNMNVNRYQ